MADSFGLAFYKAQTAAGLTLPREGTVLVTTADKDKSTVLQAVKRLVDNGFNIVATVGTAAYLTDHGIKCSVIKKLHEGRPNIVDALHNGEIQLLINTPAGKDSAYDDSYIRKSAIKYRVPYVTTPAAAAAAALGIEAALNSQSSVKSLQEYNKGINILCSQECVQPAAADMVSQD